MKKAVVRFRHDLRRFLKEFGLQRREVWPRGIALSAQVLAQAAGPLLSGALRDWSGDYRLSLECFVALAAASTLAVLLARQPRLRETPSSD